MTEESHCASANLGIVSIVSYLGTQRQTFVPSGNSTWFGAMGGGDNSGDSNTISAIAANCSIRTLTLLRALLYPPLSVLETRDKKV
jgi:hypothetical protein